MQQMTARIARVNLSLGIVRIEEDRAFYQWLGGRGYGVWIIANEVAPDASPLSEENKIVLATGCFTGTELPGSSRTELITKNVLSKGISYSSGGGNFAVELKKAGFDAVIIEGRASQHVYLEIKDHILSIKDASSLWGKTTWETEDRLRQQLDDPEVSVASIGPAGEKLSQIACVIIDKAHALAWGGSGAIWGSKNLKAIVARGTGNIELSCTEGFGEVVAKYKWILHSSNASHALREGGTHGMAGVGGWSGEVPTSVRNLQEEYWESEKSQLINEQAFRKYEKKRTTCYNCSLSCLHWYEMEQDGEILACEGIHANTVRGLGSNWDLTEPFALLKAHALCNQYGLDVDGVSAAVAWALECFERGLINKIDTHGLELKWGNAPDILRLVEDIGNDRNFGQILTKGVAQAAKIIGKGTADCVVIHVLS